MKTMLPDKGYYYLIPMFALLSPVYLVFMKRKQRDFHRGISNIYYITTSVKELICVCTARANTCNLHNC